MKAAGYIVQTQAGLRGRTRHTDHLVNGKIIVYLEDQASEPVLDDKGQQKKLLCDRAKLKLIGYVD